MDKLPTEITLIIFDYINKITDKRQFLRTCKKYYEITKNSMQIAETNFKVKHFDNEKYYGVEKFTLELCDDKYFDKIPFSYFNESNKVIMKLLTIHGQLELIKFGVSKSCTFNYICSEFAAAYGHLEILKWSQLNNYHIDINWLLTIAAQNGQLEVLKWVNSNKIKNDITSESSGGSTTSLYISDLDICKQAALNGHIEILKWCKGNGYDWNVNTCSGAALNGHFEVLKWLRVNGCVWDKSSCVNAAKNGHFEILKWLRENDCPWGNTCTAAAYNGHFETLKWARANGAPWSESTCKYAAYNGHFETLKWLRENGCPWSPDSCSAAAQNGQFEILKWLRKNGCPWTIDTCTDAYNSGHIDILKWCIENGCECGERILKKVMEKNCDEEGNDSKFDD